MKNVRKAMVPLFWFVVFLTACSAATTQSIQPTHTPRSMTETAAPAFTATFDPNLATPIPPTRDPNSVAPPSPDQQVYVDPAGWYSVNLPANMQHLDQPNQFFGSDGDFFETDYLPKLGYMSNIMDVCIWLANLELDPKQSDVGFVLDGNRTDPNACTIFSADGGYKVKYLVRRNFGGDPEHRFVYLETKSTTDNLPHLSYTIESSLSWLGGPFQTAPAASATPWSTEEATFWKNAAIAMPSNISVRESDSRSINDKYTSELEPKPTSPSKVTLESLGYKFRIINDGEKYAQLYRDGRLLFDNARHVSDIYTFSTASGPITAFVVEVDTYNAWKHFLIQNDAISAWADPAAYNPGWPPILYQGELLWAIVMQGSQIEIKKSSGETVFTFETYYATKSPLITFKSWNGHWIMEEADFVVQDGEILNQKLGFDEIFNWRLIKDKPFYFFRKGASVGVSYDGHILPLRYDDITHGLCCEPARNNPWAGNDFVSFQAQQNGASKYVLLEFK